MYSFDRSLLCQPAQAGFPFGATCFSTQPEKTCANHSSSVTRAWCAALQVHCHRPNVTQPTSPTTPASLLPSSSLLARLTTFTFRSATAARSRVTTRAASPLFLRRRPPILKSQTRHSTVTITECRVRVRLFSGGRLLRKSCACGAAQKIALARLVDDGCMAALLVKAHARAGRPHGAARAAGMKGELRLSRSEPAGRARVTCPSHIL